MSQKFSISDLIAADDTIDILDIGAMVFGSGGEAYAPLREIGKVRVLGFEPDATECAKLNEKAGDNERYYPYFVGDGNSATYYKTNMPMTGSLFAPHTALLEKFQNLNEVTTLVETHDVETVRLDDIQELTNVDYIKIDVQGAELDVFQNGSMVLGQTMVVHTEVCFVELYKGQPLFADIDTHLRSKGFQFHTVDYFGGRCFKPFVVENNVNKGLNQQLWADAIYVRDFLTFDEVPDDKLIKLAVILNDVYQSFDFCYYALDHLDKRDGGSRAADYLGRIEKAASSDSV